VIGLDRLGGLAHEDGVVVTVDAAHHV
jgi:hypothetical protein